MLVFITSYYFSPCHYFHFPILFPDIPSLLFTVYSHSFTRFFTINLLSFVASFEYTIASSFHSPYSSCENIISFAVNLPFQYYLSPSLFLLSQYFFPTASISIDLPRSQSCYLLLFYRSSHMFPRSSIFQFSSSHPALLFPLRYHLFLFRIPPPVHCSSQNDFSVGFISCANNLPNSYFSL